MLPVFAVTLSFILPRSILRNKEDLDQIFQKSRPDESYQDRVTSLDTLERFQETQGQDSCVFLDRKVESSQASAFNFAASVH
jgi:hypothetical protein